MSLFKISAQKVCLLTQDLKHDYLTHALTLLIDITQTFNDDDLSWYYVKVGFGKYLCARNINQSRGGGCQAQGQ